MDLMISSQVIQTVKSGVLLAVVAGDLSVQAYVVIEPQDLHVVEDLLCRRDGRVRDALDRIRAREGGGGGAFDRFLRRIARLRLRVLQVLRVLKARSPGGY